MSWVSIICEGTLEWKHMLLSRSALVWASNASTEIISNIHVWDKAASSDITTFRKMIVPMFIRGGPIFCTGFSILSAKGFRWVGGFQKPVRKDFWDFKNPRTTGWGLMHPSETVKNLWLRIMKRYDSDCLNKMQHALSSCQREFTDLVWAII